MNTATVLTALRRTQRALSLAVFLELTAYLYSPSTTLRSNQSFDFIVVGGGSAGSVVATRLAQLRRYRVLLIEAGGDPPYETTFPGLVSYLPDSHVDWNFTGKVDSNDCHRCKSARIVQGKMLGGSGELQYMVYSRGHPSDYSYWAKITKDPTWRWNNVLPQFRKLDALINTGVDDPNGRLYGTEGYLGVTRDNFSETDNYLEGFKQAGNDIISNNDGTNIGYGRGLIMVDNGERQGPSKYLTHVKNNKYLYIAKNTLAVKIIVDNNKAVGLEVINDKNGNVTVKANKEIIVTAGAIKTPQLLMLSGIGPRKYLKSMGIKTIVDLPVGDNLHDPPAALLFHTTNRAGDSYRTRNDPRKYPAGLFVGYAAINNSSSEESNERPDYEAMGFIIKNETYLIQECAGRFRFKNKICDKLYNQTIGQEVLMTIIYGVNDKSRGQVLLRSTDPKDCPKIDLDFYDNKRDLTDMISFIKDYIKVEDTKAFKGIGARRIDITSSKCGGFDKGTDESWRCYIKCLTISLGHYYGTSAMGSVVDGKLKVYGIKGLRVADASVIPQVSGNSFIPTMMVAEKAAEMIEQEWD